MLHGEWKQGTASQIADYYADYYMEEGKGYWHGEFKDRLGLPDEVTRDDLIALLSNRTPKGERITQRDNAKRRKCLELTFSAPKSLSVMHAITGDARIQSAFDKAVSLTMQHIEKDAARRLRAGGMNADIVTSNLIYASFGQGLGRPVNGVSDPQMHNHCLLMNCSWDAVQQKWFALQAGQIKTDLPHYQAFFRQTLAEQILALGYHIKTARQNFEIDGIDKSTLDKFSNRTKEVEAEAAKRGITKAETKAQLGRMTRDKKTEKYTLDQLQEIWAGRLTPHEMKNLTDIHLNSLGYGSIRTRDQSAHYTEQAVEHLTGKDTYTTERKVMTYALQKGIGKVTVEGIKDTIHHQVARGAWIRQKNNPEKLTTKKALLKDIKVKDMWKAGLGKHEKLGRDEYTVQAPDKPHFHAIPKVKGSRDRFTSLRGNIGRDPVVGRLALDLNAGIVQDLNNPPENDVWIVGQITDSGKYDLMKEAVERDKRVIFVGDKNRSRLEEDLNLEPVFMFDIKKPIQRSSKRLKNFILNQLRSADVRIEQEPRRSRPEPRYSVPAQAHGGPDR